MSVELKPVTLESLSQIQHAFLLGTHPGKWYEKIVLVLRFTGACREGQEGDADASFMGAQGNAGIHAFDPDATIVDISALKYEKGDAMSAVLDLGCQLRRPQAIVIGPDCRTGLAALWFGPGTTRDVCEAENIFDSFDAAWEYVTRLLGEQDKEG